MDVILFLKILVIEAIFDISCSTEARLNLTGPA